MLFTPAAGQGRRGGRCARHESVQSALGSTPPCRRLWCWPVALQTRRTGMQTAMQGSRGWLGAAAACCPPLCHSSSAGHAGTPCRPGHQGVGPGRGQDEEGRGEGATLSHAEPRCAMPSHAACACRGVRQGRTVCVFRLRAAARPASLKLPSAPGRDPLAAGVQADHHC